MTRTLFITCTVFLLAGCSQASNPLSIASTPVSTNHQVKMDTFSLSSPLASRTPAPTTPNMSMLPSPLSSGNSCTIGIVVGSMVQVPPNVLNCGTYAIVSDKSCGTPARVARDWAIVGGLKGIATLQEVQAGGGCIQVDADNNCSFKITTCPANIKANNVGTGQNTRCIWARFDGTTSPYLYSPPDKMYVGTGYLYTSSCSTTVPN